MEQVEDNVYEYTVPFPVSTCVDAWNARYPRHRSHDGLLNAEQVTQSSDEKGNSTLTRQVSSVMNLPDWLARFAGSAMSWNTYETIEQSPRRGSATITGTLRTGHVT